MAFNWQWQARRCRLAQQWCASPDDSLMQEDASGGALQVGAGMLVARLLPYHLAARPVTSATGPSSSLTKPQLHCSLPHILHHSPASPQQ